jgi:hypothetical protein
VQLIKNKIIRILLLNQNIRFLLLILQSLVKKIGYPYKNSPYFYKSE